MKLQEFGLLTGENILMPVVEFLRNEGFDVLDVKERGLFGSTDIELIRMALC